MARWCPGTQRRSTSRRTRCTTAPASSRASARHVGQTGDFLPGGAHEAALQFKQGLPHGDSLHAGRDQPGHPGDGDLHAVHGPVSGLRGAGAGHRGRCQFLGPHGAQYVPGGGRSRRCVIILAQDLGYTVEEAQIPRELLYMADELFFTGTAAEFTLSAASTTFPSARSSRRCRTRSSASWRGRWRIGTGG